MVGARPGGGAVTAMGLGAAMPFRGRAPLARRGPSRAGLLAAVRLLVWTALWGTVLRNIGASVGVWAAGSLGAGVTILIGVVIPAWLFVVFPGWLAFRVAAPHGMRRLALAACWMSPLVRMRDLPSIAAYFDVAADRPCPGWGELPADAWTALSAAVQADRRRSLAHAARIVDALAHLPDGARFPWLARVHAVETLVLSAASRRDWPAAARYARIGQGRLVRLLALVAGGIDGETAPARRLWIRWLLAPMRRTTFPLVRAVARRARITSRVRPLSAPTTPRTVFVRHLAMLDAAARHEEIHSDDVLALAVAWQGEIDDAALARLRARALELGVRDGAARALALREQVLDELALLLACAEGEASRLGAPAIGDTLASRARDRQLARIRFTFDTLATPDVDRVGGPLPPLEAWERWLALRAAWERAEQNAGRAALAALWRARVRDGLWSHCCALSHQHGPRAAWAVYVMFDWLADRAEYVGDLVAMLANRENARIARASMR
jgi:hypothetical protein